MRTRIQFLILIVALLVPLAASAQQQVTIRELHTFAEPFNATAAEIGAHPLSGVDVTFTAVIVSNPRSSGLATFTEGAGTISRIHVFVTDTTAIGDANGRDGMSIQIVDSDVELLENLLRGGIFTFRGTMGNFFSTVQFDLSEAPVEVGNVTDPAFARYAPLLNPITVTLDELNTNNGDGTYQINAANYTKYINAYVQVDSASVIVQELGDRPNWAIDRGSRVWMYDTGLRVRNDRLDNYRAGYNFRRSTANGGEDAFVPPPSGALATVSGFVVLNNDNPGGDNADGTETFNINPFEDGTFWSTDGTTRFENGQDLGGGVIFSWPNDINVVGLPPLISNVVRNPATAIVNSATMATITADVVAQGAGVTIDSVRVVYSATGVAQTTVIMNNTGGDTFSATLPAFNNLSSVSYAIEAFGSDDLDGRFPAVGFDGFFVSDSNLNSIEVVQRTADDSTGASPLAGAGLIPFDITATVVNSSDMGPIIIHDGSGPWSGVFLERSTATNALAVGDQINITMAEVVEVNTSGGELTQLTNLTFTTVSTGNSITALIPSLITDDLRSMEKDGEIEPYEAMVLMLEDAMFINEGRFGEFTVSNRGMGVTEFPMEGIIVNEDVRSDDIGETPYNDNFAGDTDVNWHVRDNTIFTSITGIMVSSFGAPKFVPRDLDDLVGTNWSFPVLDFDLVSPADDATVEVNDDLNFVWAASRDYDGDAITYEWVLYSAADTSEVMKMTSNSSGDDATATIPFDTIDGILAAAGLTTGQNRDYLWNARVSDGNDTLGVSQDYDEDNDMFETLYRPITLTRALQVSTDDDSGFGIPTEYGLDQNYPNPFNPTTNIRFALPQSSKVSLTVYNLLGQQVATLINGEQRAAGRYTVPFDASSLASGLYVYRIQAGSFIQTRKMLLIK